MDNYIRKIIREEISKIFEIQEFQSAAAQQMAMSMAVYKLPRKGIDDSINYFDQLQFQLGKDETQDEKNKNLETQFNVPAINGPAAITSTNIFEELDVKESYGIYGSTQAAQQNLDWVGKTSTQTSSFGKESQEEFDLHNNNIKRSLEEIPPGNSREGETH